MWYIEKQEILWYLITRDNRDESGDPAQSRKLTTKSQNTEGYSRKMWVETDDSEQELGAKRGESNMQGTTPPLKIM